MRRIAIISDIHGNLAALEAVLVDIDTIYKTDEIYCLGDLVDAAPYHNEVIQLIKKRGILTVMGNHDERIAFDGKIIPRSKHSPEETQARIIAINYTKESITKENKAHLATFKSEIKVEIGGVSILLVHGSPSSNSEYVFEDHDVAEVEEWLCTSGADILITGHTHYSYIRAIPSPKNRGSQFIVNAGSVGRTRENIGAKAVYLWLTINDDDSFEFTLRKIDYDVNRTIQAIKASPIPNFYALFLEKYLS